MTFKVNGKEIQAKENKGFLQIDITDIKASELMNDFTITVGENGTVKYSVMNYCQSVLAGSGDHKDVIRALYLYAKAAADFNGNNA